MTTTTARPGPPDRLGDALDDAIPRPPEDTDPSRALRAGRRAVARRRAAGVGVGALSLAVVLGLVGLVTAGGPGAQTAVDPATATPAGPADTAPTPVPGSQYDVRSDVDAVVDPDATSVGISDDGRLVVPPAVEVRGVIQEPLGLQAPAHSIAAETFDPDLPARYAVRWEYLTVQPDLVAGGEAPLGVEEDGRTGISAPASSNPDLTLAQWVHTLVAYGPFAWPYTGLASEPYLALDGSLVLPDTARLVARVDNPLGLRGTQRSLAVAWTDLGDSTARTEQWAVLVQDTTWRSGQPNPLGLVDGFARQRQDAEPGADFSAWADAQTRAGFEADAPPAWVGQGRR